MADDTLARLFVVLDQERHALLNAHYDSLPELAATKEACFQCLAQAPPPKKILQTLKAQVGENQGLIAAALRGVDAARNRIAALENVRDVLTTYDLSGKVTLTPTVQKTVEKKA